MLLTIHLRRIRQLNQPPNVPVHFRSCCDAALCLLQAKFERLQKKIEAVEQATTKKVNEDIMTQEIRLLKTIVAMEAAAAESP